MKAAAGEKAFGHTSASHLCPASTSSTICLPGGAPRVPSTAWCWANEIHPERRAYGCLRPHSRFAYNNRAVELMSDLRFDGRVAVITGGGRGLGRAYALLLASHGAKVVVNDPGVAITGDGTDAGPAEEVVREITATGGEAVASIDSVATPED